MAQLYHQNATTNIHIRSKIQTSNLRNKNLAKMYNISEKTVRKWKSRDFIHDKSSRPNTIHYSLSDIEKQLIVSIRKSTWLSIDDIHEIMMQYKKDISYSAVYRVLVKEGLNKVPEEKKEKAKKFKEYEPGYLHIDVTYFPKIEEIRYYLFIAIDRATRLMCYKIYTAKSAENAESFLNFCLQFFPFKITHILTDNGLEFTNILIKSKNGKYCSKPSLVDKVCEKENIQHRLTKPNTPKTNGMVERANGIVKDNTILKEKYNNADEMRAALNKFLLYYIFNRKHGSLKKELNVKTPYNSVEWWYKNKPEIFIKNLLEFKNFIYLHFDSS